MASVGSYDEEGPLDDPQAPMTVYMESTRARRILFVTKDAMARYWLRNDLLPPSTAVFVLHGPATARHCALLKQAADERSVPVLFYGDLDPMDLTTFGTLRAGGTRWDFNPETAVEVEYRGIDDRVLGWAEQNCKLRSRGNACGPLPQLSRLLIRQVRPERRHLKVLEQVMPDLEDLVGPRCMGLLRNGWKLEVEALHPQSYKRGFEAKLMQLVLDRRR